MRKNGGRSKKAPNFDLPQDLEAALDPGEKVVWAEKPDFWGYVLGQFGPVWGALPMAGLLFFIGSLGRDKAAGFNFHQYLAIGVVCLVLGGALLHGILTYANAYYAITTRRYFMRTGFFGVDMTALDFDRVRSVRADVGPVEKLLGVGKLVIDVGHADHRGQPQFHTFYGLRQPYQAFKVAKGTGMDIKTDIHYPNARRPKVNPGYRSEYRPAQKKRAR